ncbi:MAG: invasin domain 3-containing protein [Pseudomonadota bacterium]
MVGFGANIFIKNEFEALAYADFRLVASALSAVVSAFLLLLMSFAPTHAAEKTYRRENIGATWPNQGWQEFSIDVPDDITVEKMRFTADIFATSVNFVDIELIHPDGPSLFLVSDVCRQTPRSNSGGSIPVGFGQRVYKGNSVYPFNAEESIDPEAEPGVSETYTWQDGGSNIWRACYSLWPDVAPTGWGNGLDWSANGSWSKINANSISPSGPATPNTDYGNPQSFSDFYGESAKGNWTVRINSYQPVSHMWDHRSYNPVQLNALSLTFEYDVAVDVEASQITADPAEIDADGISTSTITVQLKDAEGNELTESGGTVALELDGSGTLETVEDNQNGSYTAILTSSKIAETVTIKGTLDGRPLSDDATVEYVEPDYDAESNSELVETGTDQSVISAVPALIDADGVSTTAILVQLRDNEGNELTESGGTVTLELNGSGTLGPVKDNEDGTYAAILTSSTTPETVAVTGALNEVALPEFAMVEYVPLVYKAEIVANPTILDANGISTSTIVVQLKDAEGNNLAVRGRTVELELDGSGMLSSVTDNGDGAYSATLTSSTTLVPEIVTITGTLDGEPISDDATVEYVPLINVPAQTSRVIRNFMADRADEIIANDVSLVERLINRGSLNGQFPISLNGGELFLGALAGLGAQGQGLPDKLNSVFFSTSLNQIKAFKLSFDQKYETQFGAGSGNYQQFSPTVSKFDVWLEGRYAFIDQAGRESELGLLRIGVDYLLNPDLLVGVMGQLDVFDQDIDVLNASVRGDGFMIGPYIVGRLGENLILEGRGLWGRSENDVNPLGLYTDNFQTERWMVKGSVTGDFSVGTWKFAPAISAYYFEETQEAYIDNLGFEIDEQTIDLGRVTFGPKVSFDRKLGDDVVITPHIKLEGIWDFDPSDQVDLNGVAIYSTEEVRARIEAGVEFQSPTGSLLSISGFYDGLGTESLEAYGGNFRLFVPIGGTGSVAEPTPTSSFANRESSGRG